MCSKYCYPTSVSLNCTITLRHSHESRITHMGESMKINVIYKNIIADFTHLGDDEVYF